MKTNYSQISLLLYEPQREEQSSLHARIQDFYSGWVQARRPENSLDNVFLLFNLFYSLLQRGSNGFITEKTVLFQGSIGVQHFPGGGGGVQMLISIETHITCDFVGAGGPDQLPPPPLDPHMVCICLGICL